MTDLRQAAQQALEAWDDPMKDLKDLCVAMDAIRTALEQQAEPVALWQKRHPLRTEGAWENTNEHDAKWWSEKAQGWEIRTLYTTPPQRQWVGLTDEEANLLWENTDDRDSWELIKRVEIKLKERNT